MKSPFSKDKNEGQDRAETNAGAAAAGGQRDPAMSDNHGDGNRTAQETADTAEAQNEPSPQELQQKAGDSPAAKAFREASENRKPGWTGDGVQDAHRADGVAGGNAKEALADSTSATNDAKLNDGGDSRSDASGEATTGHRGDDA